MRVKILVCIIAVCMASPLFGQERAPLKEKKDRLSYAIGADIGATIKKQSVDVNLDLLQQGIRDALTGSKLLLSDQEIADTKAAMEKDMAEAKEKQRKAVAEKNKKEQEKFLAENRQKEGVVALPSGLQYKVIKEGTGRTPKPDDAVLAHYRVSLIDGKEIEDSQKKGEPGEFVLENVIPGWKEGVGKMKVGSRWQLFVPSELAYGEEGVGDVVSPNTMLIFDVELLKIIEKPAGNTADTAETKDSEAK